MKAIRWLQAKVLWTVLMVFLFEFFMLPSLEIHNLGKQMQLSVRNHDALAVGLTLPGISNPPKPADTNPPDDVLRVAWARLAGREDAVYLDIPSNQLSNVSALPSASQPVILAKYDHLNAVGRIALMRILHVGASVRAEIVELSPNNFQHNFGKHLQNFAWLENNNSCAYSDMYLRTDDPPATTTETISKAFMPLDYGESWITPGFSLGADQLKVNRSYQYWHQRINNSGCWNKVRLGQFDLGTGMWHGISYQGLLDVVALAMQVHNGSSAWIVQDSVSTTQESSSKKSFMRISMTSTTRWYINTGGWMVGTRASNGILADYVSNPMQQPGMDIAFTSAAVGHNLPMGSQMVYEKSITKKAWTGAFVFVASLVVGILTGGIAGMMLSVLMPGIIAGAAIGGLGGLMASGFHPTTSQACSFTPFNNTATQLKPDYSSDTDKAMLQVMTYFKWLGPSIETSAGLAAYVMELHPKKILGCGGQAWADCGGMADVIGMDDPRFTTLMNTMYHQPAREVQEHVYPYAPR